MPKVEWADAPAVSRSAPTLRDKPEAGRDPFAAVFDSARRRTGSRVDQAARDGQHAAVPEHRPAAEKEKPAPAESGRQQEQPKDPTELPAPPSNVEARHSEPAEEQEDGVEPRPAAEQPSQVDVADDSSPTVVQIQAQYAAPQVMPETGTSAQAETVEGEIEPTRLETADNAAGETQVVTGTDQTVRLQPWQPVPQENQAELMSTAVETPAIESPDVAAVASSLAAMMPDLSVPCEESPCEPDQSSVPQAANSSPVAGAPASSDAVPQPAPGEVVTSSPEQSISVWQLLRGVAAHLERVIEAQTRRPADAPNLPAQAAERNPAAEVSAARPPATLIATALRIAGLDGADAAGQQNQDQGGAQSGDDAAAGSESSGKTARPWEASTHQTGATDDFRNLIEVSSRIRDQIISPGLQSGSTLIGREPPGKGVGLNEARAMTDLADVVRANIGARHSSMVLRLDPPELGQVRIDVRMHGDELTLRLQADTLVGRDALMSRLNDLRSSLEQHGFRLNQMEVELRVPQGSPPESHQDGSARQQAQWDGQNSQTPGWQGQAAGGGQTSSGSESSNEGFAFSQENALSGEEIDWVQGPAETGVDLVV